MAQHAAACEPSMKVHAHVHYRTLLPFQALVTGSMGSFVILFCYEAPTGQLELDIICKGSVREKGSAYQDLHLHCKAKRLLHAGSCLHNDSSVDIKRQGVSIPKC